MFESILKDRKAPYLEEPTHPGNDASRSLVFKWEIEMKRYFENKADCNNGSFGLWAMIDGQVLSLAKTGAKAVKGHGDDYEKKYFMWLLATCEKVTSRIHSNQQSAASIIQTRKKAVLVNTTTTSNFT